MSLPLLPRINGSGEQPVWPSRTGRQERYRTGPIAGIVSTAELSISICRRWISGCAALSDRSIELEPALRSSSSRLRAAIDKNGK